MPTVFTGNVGYTKGWTMEFLDPKQKRRRNQRLFFGYCLFVVAIFMATVILVYRASGYDIDRTTGEVVLKGILIIKTEPVDAEVTIDGERRSEGVDARISLPYGTHSVELTAEGYRPWKKEVTIDGGSVELLHYPRLFPTDVTAVAVTHYTGRPLFMSQSLDRRWVVVGVAGTQKQLHIFDTSKDTLTAESVTLSADLIAADAIATSFAVDEWADDDQHFLLSYSRPSGKEFIWVDRDNVTNSFAINQVFSVSPVKTQFAGGDASRVYVFENNAAVVRIADMRSKTLSVPITSSAIVSYALDDTLYYATRDTETSDTAIFRVHSDNKDYILAQVPVENILDPVAVTYDGHDYVLITAHAPTGTFVRLYRDPLETLKNGSKLLPDPLRAAVLKDIQKILISPDKRFILIAGTDSQVVFDIELGRQYKLQLPDLSTDVASLHWLDDTHLAYARNATLQVAEFDGHNQEALTPILSAGPAYLDRKANRLVVLATAGDTKLALKYVPLELKR